MKKNNKSIQTESARETSQPNPQYSSLTPSAIPRNMYQQQIASTYNPASSRENDRRASNPLPLGSGPVVPPERTRRRSAPDRFPDLQKLELGDDEVVVMDDVVVASATRKKGTMPSSDFGSVSVEGTASSSGRQNPHRNCESCNVWSEIGHNQERINPQQSTTSKGKAQATVPSNTGHEPKVSSQQSFVDARCLANMPRPRVGSPVRTPPASPPRPFGGYHRQRPYSPSRMGPNSPRRAPSVPSAWRTPPGSPPPVLYAYPPPLHAVSPPHKMIPHGREISTRSRPCNFYQNSPLAQRSLSGRATAASFYTAPPTGSSSVPTTISKKPKNIGTTLPHTPTTTSEAESSTRTTKDWSPQDDGIEPGLPDDPFECRQRLQVFSEISSDDPPESN